MSTAKCFDKEAMDLVHHVARSLEGLCKSAVIVLTTDCPEESHGNHVSVAIASRGMRPSEASFLCLKLRALADELERKHCPPGSEN